MDLVSMVHGHVTDMVTVQMAQMKLTVAVEQTVPMVNLTVAMDLVSMVHGHVTDMVTVQMAQMKLTVAVVQIVPMVNLTVVPIVDLMVNVSMVHGHVMALLTVLTVQTKLTVVNLHHVKIKVYGIVAMANVFQHHMYVMDQVNSVTQAGVLTVSMAQMKA
jgi:hypothetical protein